NSSVCWSSFWHIAIVIVLTRVRRLNTNIQPLLHSDNFLATVIVSVPSIVFLPDQIVLLSLSSTALNKSSICFFYCFKVDPLFNFTLFSNVTWYKCLFITFNF